MDHTPHYGLVVLRGGDNWSDEDYAFSDRNVRMLEQLGYLGAEGHRHTGAGIAVEDPTLQLGTTLDTTVGNIPGGRTVRYRYSWVNALGAETAASPEIVVPTPTPIAPPEAPALSRSASGGFHRPGNYYYLLTAYKTSNTLETQAGARAYITVPSGETNKLTLDLPSLPSGATGFNVYRRLPGSFQFLYVTSINMNVATPPSTWEDTGLIIENCSRTVPRVNTTGSSNTITVTLPEPIPEDCSWKLYRSYTGGDWDSSLLSWVVEGDTTFDDVGAGTLAGSPLDESQMVGSPSKIDLATEVNGVLPPGMITSHDQITFSHGGAATAVDGVFAWTNEHELADILGVRVTCGPATTPVTNDVVIDIERAPEGSDTFTTIYTTSGNRPKVEVGEWKGVPTVPDVQRLEQGDVLMLNIAEGDADAANLCITLFMAVKSGLTTSYDWS